MPVGQVGQVGQVGPAGQKHETPAYDAGVFSIATGNNTSGRQSNSLLSAVAYSLLNSTAIKKVCFQRDPKGSVLFENRPEIQITRISTRDAAAGAAAEEPVYDDAWAAGAAEAVSRAPVSEELLSAAEPVWGELLSAAELVWRELLSAAEPVWPVRPSVPGHTADSASGPDRAMAAAERPAPRRH